jgi:hypothetical protein
VTPKPPEQPVEPAPPNRWKAFTEIELRLIGGSIVNIGLPETGALYREIEDEVQRRRSQQ